MKININKNEFLKILKFNEKIVENKNTNNPVLFCINLSFNKQNSKCICSNGVISGSYTINPNKIEVIEPGKVIVKNKILLDMVSKLEDDIITLNKVENSVLTIKTKSFSSNINTLDESSYPNINFLNENLPKISISIKDLFQIFKKNSNCVLNEINQTKVIGGIYFDTKINENQLTTLSTDTFKLAYLKSQVEKTQDVKFVLNTLTLNIVSQFFKDSEKKINFYVDEVNKKIYIEDNGVIIIDRSISGDFPVDIFVKAFEINPKLKVCINKNQIINALEIAKVAVNQEKNPTIIFDFKNNQLELTSSSFEIGSTQKNVELISYEGQDIKIAFNISFLITLFKNIDSENIKLSIETNLKPMLIQGDNNNFAELILPIRLND